MSVIVPVVLFAYNRPAHLMKTLECLRENKVPLIYAFSDGPKNAEHVEGVNQTRTILHNVSWCEINVVEREENLGLGNSILSGVEEVLKKHEAIIVFEDDLVCIPGTYSYMAAALNQYANDPKVMSVTGWTHPRSTPANITNQPYFDGRTESWSWGTWARVWNNGMKRTAQELVTACIENGVDIYRYGADLPEMAKIELRQNIWAVRFAYLHILNGGLCLRPPYSLVEHAGFDELATNAKDGKIWAHSIKQEFAPPIPSKWPDPVENRECSTLWQEACGGKPRPLPRIKILVKNLHKYIQSKFLGSLEFTKRK